VNPVVTCIVEGHGEQRAVPLLVRRIAESLPAPVYVDVPPAIRIPRTRLVRVGELERATKLAVSRVVESQVAGGGVLVLIDADTDCAALLGPELLARARSVAGAIPVEVVLAVMEFEAWFLAALTSLRGQRRIQSDAEAPPNPEAVRGAKEALRRQMAPGSAYSPPTDQPALAALMDLDAARAAPSFDKLWRAIAGILAASE
jgi:Domain of unknown function (DUF4276)